MKKASWLMRKFWKPQKIIKMENGIIECGFSPSPRFREGDAIITPMESGRMALLRIYHVWTPCDPGDQHFYRYEFIRYLI